MPGMENLDDYVIKKHNAIINRSHAPTASAEKVFSAFLLVARSYLKTYGEPDHGYYTTTIKFLRNFAGIKGTSNELIKDVFTSLQTCPWQFDLLLEDEKQEWRSFAPLSEVRIDKFGVVKFFFAPSIQEALTNPSIYTMIDLKIVRGLKSVYSIALYELGMSHIGRKVDFSVVDLRKYMGVEEGVYQKITDLRRYVVEVAVKEVNDKTDILVEYLILRNGERGSISGFSFSFSQLDEAEILPESYQIELIAELSVLMPEKIRTQRGITPLLKRYLESKGFDYVHSNIVYFVERLEDKNQKPIPNPGGYLRRVLEDDYGVEIRERIEIEKMIAKRKQEAMASKEEKSSNESSVGEEEMLRQQTEAYYAYFSELPADRQEEIMVAISVPPLNFGPMKSRIMYYLKMEEGVIL